MEREMPCIDTKSTGTVYIYIYAYKLLCTSARNGVDMAVKANIGKLIGTDQVLTGIKRFFFFF